MRALGMTWMVCVFLALIAGGAQADEITLKNGSVMEGKIVEETPDKIVIETDFGKITIRRSQIKSIKRYRGPKSFEKPSGESGPGTDPPPGAIRLPDVGGYFLPPPPPWVRSKPKEAGNIVFQNGTSAFLRIRVMDTAGRREGSLQEFIREYKRAYLSNSKLIGEKTYLHGGRPAFEFETKPRLAPDIMKKDFLIELGKKKVVVELSGKSAEFRTFLVDYAGLLDTLRLPGVLRSGKTVASLPLEVWNPQLLISHSPPTGPWRFKKKTKEGMKVFSYSRRDECLIDVVVTYWDGHGKYTADLIEGIGKRLAVLSPGTAFEMRNKRYYDMGKRVEFSADFSLESGGVRFQGKVFLAHEACGVAMLFGAVVTGKMGIYEKVIAGIRKSIKIEKDWVQTLSNDYWREIRFEESGVRFKVPKWWKKTKMGWVSPGQSVVLPTIDDTGPRIPNREDVKKYLMKVNLPNFKNFEILEDEDIEVKGVPGMKIMIKGNLHLMGRDFEMKGEFFGLHRKGKFFQLLILSPSLGLERLALIFRKMKNSITFE